MRSLDLKDVTAYVEANIGTFHQARLHSLDTLRLDKILQRKNPYLYRAKNIIDPHDLVKILLDAHLSSQEESIFGEFLEKLAIFICGKVFGGDKSKAEGIDLEFERDGKQYIVAIKSGPNWGNSSQIKRMRDNFKQAARIFRTNNRAANLVAVNGCCYGRDAKPDKGDYFKYCGQIFWEFVSGDADLYTQIVEPLGHQARERNDDFALAYTRIVGNFTDEFKQSYCVDQLIDWDKLVRFNSAAIWPKKQKIPND